MSSFRVIRLMGWLAGAAFVTTPALAQDKKPIKHERNRISREELVEAADRFQDLHNAIRSLRPHFLAPNNRGARTTGVGERASSGGNSPSEGSYGTGGSNNANAVPVVYLDGRKSGDPDYLKGLLTRDVEEVRYLSPNEASMEYGLGHEGGAIVVRLYKGS